MRSESVRHRGRGLRADTGQPEIRQDGQGSAEGLSEKRSEVESRSGPLTIRARTAITMDGAGRIPAGLVDGSISAVSASDLGVDGRSTDEAVEMSHKSSRSRCRRCRSVPSGCDAEFGVRTNQATSCDSVSRRLAPTMVTRSDDSVDHTAPLLN